eukprot:541921-Prymnesium_polylepis.1
MPLPGKAAPLELPQEGGAPPALTPMSLLTRSASMEWMGSTADLGAPAAEVPLLALPVQPPTPPGPPAMPPRTASGCTGESATSHIRR